MIALEIRAATADDLPAVLELYDELEDAPGRQLTPEAARAIFERMRTYPDYTLYVAVQEGVAIGTFTLLIMDKLAHVGAAAGIVEDVVVSAGKQGQGIGRQMMEFAMARCRDKGCYKLALSSNSKREAAHRFYESLGFEKHGYSFSIELAR